MLKVIKMVTMMIVGYRKGNCMKKLQELLKHYQDYELRFFALVEKCGFSVDDEETWQECYISDSRYRYSNDRYGYKLTLVPLDENYCIRDYYVQDFDSLLESGHIVLKTSITMRNQKIKWCENIGGLNVIHEGNALVE